MTWIFSLFFLLSAAFERDFAYLRIWIGPAPLFVSDGVLALVLMHSFWKWKRGKLKVPPLFLTFWVLFLGWGTLRLMGSFFLEEMDHGPIKALRDFALVYQCLWMLLAFSFTKEDFLKFLSALFLGAGLAEIVGWGSFLYQGCYYLEVCREHIGSLFGNEAVTPLFPLAFAVWSPMSAGLLMMLFGHTFLGLILVYLKKSWVFTLLCISLPAGLLLPHARFISKAFAPQKRIKFAVYGLLVGMAIACGTLYYVSNRPFVKEGKSITGDLKTNLDHGVIWRKNPMYFIFHGDLNVNEKGEVVSFFRYRSHLWKRTFQRSLETPLQGRGFGPLVVQDTAYGSLAIVSGNWISGPHNSYLTIAFRTGLLGLLPFFAMMGLAGAYWFWWGRKSTPATLAMVGCVSLSFFSFFNVCLENPQNGIWFWMFLAATVRVSQIAKQNKLG